MSSTAEAIKAHTIRCGVLIFQYPIRYFNNGFIASAITAGLRSLFMVSMVY